MGRRIKSSTCKVQAALFSKMGTDYAWNYVVCAESDEFLRQFIVRHFKVQVMAQYVRDLGSTTVKDTRSNEVVLVPPYMDSLIFAFVCVSRSSNNRFAAEMVGCVQDGQGKTGESFADTQLVARRNRPKKCLGENLKAFDVSTPEHDYSSDSNFIKDWFRKAGYWCETFIHLVRGEFRNISFSSQVAVGCRARRYQMSDAQNYTML